MSQSAVYQRLEAAGITLPVAGAPAAAYVMAAQTGNLIHVSGHIARKDGKPWVGKLGDTMTTAEGRDAARSVGIDLIATLQGATGDLGRITRIVKLVSLVHSDSAFTEQHLVTNGASELMVEIFAERGAHARSAFGVAQLPFGVCVEIEMIAEVSPA